MSCIGESDVSKYFDSDFSYDPDRAFGTSYLYEMEFNGRVEQWEWFGKIDRMGNRILHNVVHYASDTYIAIDDDSRIVGGYSYILKSGREGFKMSIVAPKAIDILKSFVDTGNHSGLQWVIKSKTSIGVNHES